MYDTLLNMSECYSVNKVVLIIEMCISWFFLCETVILVNGHEKDKVY